MSEREKMLKKVQQHTFALIEANLFLDTHPDSKQALSYYKKHQAMYSQAAAEYESKYGPLIAGAGSSETWDWVGGPWPWEYME